MWYKNFILIYINMINFMEGYVYLICDPANDKYKIGVTKDIYNKRLKKLQTGNPTELHICCIYKTKYPFRLETMLHGKFRPKNELNEWFNLNSYEISHFKEICEEQNNIIKYLVKENEFFSNGIH